MSYSIAGGLDELGVDDVPATLTTAYALDDVRRLLNFWATVITPIPDDDFDQSHPLWSSAVYVNEALCALGEQFMTPDQALATKERLGIYNPELPMARA